MTPEPKKTPSPSTAQPGRSELARPLDSSATRSSTAASAGDRGGTSTSSPTPAKASSLRKGVAAFGLLAVLAAGYWGLGGYTPGDVGGSAASSAEAAVYAKHKAANLDAALRFTTADIDRDATSRAVAAVKAGQAVPGLTEASPELRAAIERGEVEFYTIRALDTVAEDGDYITIATNNGARIGSMMITLRGATFTIPVVRGQAPAVQLIADKDGGGGVTVGIQTSGGTWYSGILAEGQLQTVPVSIR